MNYDVFHNTIEKVNSDFFLFVYVFNNLDPNFPFGKETFFKKIFTGIQWEKSK
jgi:hypothetical protein